MKINDLINDLKWRGLLKDIANKESLERIVEEGGKFYIGIDPTADSIHVGHFLSISLTKILNSYGLKPVLVLGGFTGMIGDPSGRNSEREAADSLKILDNAKKLEKQLSDLVRKMGITDVEFFNNVDVYSSMSIIDLYQKYGKLFNINTMLAKDSVKNRIENGISYTEFSYQLFQSIDYLYLYENKNVQLQIGGSDQWGNITAGIELIRKIHGPDIDASGITINLLLDDKGNKVGKTLGVPMWLDKEKTSPYILFQFFINQTDSVASKLLSQATNIDEENFILILKEHKNNPKVKTIQNELAKRFISTVHSEKDFLNAKDLSNILFEERYEDIKESQINSLDFLPTIENKDLSLMDLILDSNNVSSKREYKEFIKDKSIKINGKQVIDLEFRLKDDFIHDKFALLNIGKKNKYIIWKNKLI